MEIENKPLIQYSIDLFNPQIVNRLVFCLGHEHEAVKSWVLSANLPHIVDFTQIIESGVLDVIKMAISCIPEDTIICCNGDEIRHGLDIAKVLSFHFNASAGATMVATYTNCLYRHRVLNVQKESGLLLSSELHPDRYKFKKKEEGLVNTGFFVFSRPVVELLESIDGNSWSAVIDALCNRGMLSVYASRSIKYYNVGTEEEYCAARSFLQGQKK